MQILLIFLISRNGRSQPVVGVWVGLVVDSERFYEYLWEIAIEILSKKIKIKIFINYLIHTFWWETQSWRK
jgi:hypothetical protein